MTYVVLIGYLGLPVISSKPFGDGLATGLFSIIPIAGGIYLANIAIKTKDHPIAGIVTGGVAIAYFLPILLGTGVGFIERKISNNEVRI